MKPPTSFLQAMEEYVKDAPQGAIVRKDQVWMKHQLCFRLVYYEFMLWMDAIIKTDCMFNTHQVDRVGANETGKVPVG